MNFVCVPSLTLGFEPDGRLLARCLPRAIGARLPVPAIGILHFFQQPRSLQAIGQAMGPQAQVMANQLVQVGLLVPEDEVAETPAMFEGFARLDVHRRMIGDESRMTSYRRALEATVRAGDRVVDAGTGTGVLALMAAQAGATEVIGIEASDLAALAEAIFSANGVNGQVIRGNFASVDPGDADVIVTETFGALAFAERAAEDLAPLVARTSPRAVIPHAVSLHFAPVLTDDAETAAYGDFEGHGIDFGPLLSLGRDLGHTLALQPEWLGSSAELATVPFPTVSAASGELSFDVDPAQVRGLAGWFVLHLAPDVVLDTGPAAAPTHWKQVYFSLPSLPSGTALHVRLSVVPDPADARGLEVTADIDGRVLTWRLR
ncbi:MAG: hypothetical protein EP330_25805 [Deltaproteobacteria bacterium]|nr:MAG: hypothetical protein EP330_25805 [Deltaproteobacteria bacterium]